MREHRDTTPAKIVVPDVLEGWPSIPLTVLEQIIAANEAADVPEDDYSLTVEIETPPAWLITPVDLIRHRDESVWKMHEVYAARVGAGTAGIWIPSNHRDVRTALLALRRQCAGMRPTHFMAMTEWAANATLRYFFVSPEDHKKLCANIQRGQSLTGTPSAK